MSKRLQSAEEERKNKYVANVRHCETEMKRLFQLKLYLSLRLKRNKVFDTLDDEKFGHFYAMFLFLSLESFWFLFKPVNWYEYTKVDMFFIHLFSKRIFVVVSVAFFSILLLFIHYVGHSPVLNLYLSSDFEYGETRKWLKVIGQS